MKNEIDIKKLKSAIRLWMKDWNKYEEQFRRNSCDNDETFEGSAYDLLSAALAVLNKK